MSTRGDRDGGASGTADQQASWLGDTDLREGYAELGDGRLHYVEAGHGPLVPGVLVRMATPDRTARSGGIPRRCSRHARLQPVIATKGGRDLRRQPVDQRHQWAWAMAMQHPEVVWPGWPSSRRLTRGSCRRGCTISASYGIPGASSALTSRTHPSRSFTPTAGISSATSSAMPGRPIRRKSSIGTWRRGRSPGRQPG